MDAISLEERLSKMPTYWNVLKQAHGGSTEKREQARSWFVERYEGIVRLYLTKAVGPEGAAELVQDFATRMLEGRYHNVDEASGRFRDYLKTCLFKLVADYRKHQARGKMRSLPEGHEPADYRTGEDPADDDWRKKCQQLDGKGEAGGDQEPAENDWREKWRQDLIDHALESLKQLNQGKDRFLYPVLRLRMDQPDLTADEVATLLSERIGKQVTGGWLRKKLMQARERFAVLLLDEVAHSVNPPTRERVTDELIELNLLDYCRSLL